MAVRGVLAAGDWAVFLAVLVALGCPVGVELVAG